MVRRRTFYRNYVVVKCSLLGAHETTLHTLKVGNIIKESKVQTVLKGA